MDALFPRAFHSFLIYLGMDLTSLSGEFPVKIANRLSFLLELVVVLEKPLTLVSPNPL
jgi:hypothetical protein